MKKKTIFFITSTISGGGAERQLAILSTLLPHKEFEVHVLYTRSGSYLNFYTDSNVILHFIGYKSSYDIRIFLKICYLILKYKPSIIHTWLLQADILGGLAAIIFNLKWIMSERSSGISEKTSFIYSLRIWMVKFSNLVLTNSIQGLKFWRKQKIKSLAFIPNIYYPKFLEKKYQDNEIRIERTNKKIIFFVGRLVPQKNPINFIKAIMQVSETKKNISAYIIGDGKLFNELQVCNKNNNLISILPFSSLSSADIKRAHIFVSLSNFEGHPNTAVEFSAQKIPMVLSNIKSHRDIFSEEDVQYCDQNSIESISNAILKVLSSKKRVAELNDLSKRVIKAGNYKVLINQYIKIYNQL